MATTKPYHYSQLSRLCGLQMKYSREDVGRTGPLSVSLAMGTSLHKGLECWALSKVIDKPMLSIDPYTAADMTLRQLHDEGILYDGPARIKKDGDIYAADSNNVGDYVRASANINMWLREFQKTNNMRHPVYAELQFSVPLMSLYGVNTDIVMQGTIDRIDDDGLIWDYKTSKTHWSADKFHEKLGQAYTYMWAYNLVFGEAPRGFRFLVFARGSLEIKPWDVPYNRKAIMRYFDLEVAPKIKAAEQGIYIPNTSSPFPCSERFCDYWHMCPLGAVSHKN